MNTTLHCLSWMQNQKDQNPCMIAEKVGQLCHTGYTVSVTNFQESNYVPNATTATGCTCSWSFYNLLSACSYCVYLQDQYPSWRTWVANCGSYVSNTSYLPSGYSLLEGIPYWATQNPSGWKNGAFNIGEGSNRAGNANPDVTGGPLPTSTSTSTTSSASRVSVGAIIGGVVGAIAIIIIAGLIIWAMRRRRKTSTSFTASSSHSATVPPPSIYHRNPFPFGYTYMSPGPLSPRHTTTHSMTSQAATSPLSSPVSSGFSHGRSASQPVTDAADIITPFLAMSSTRRTNRSNTSQQNRSNKASEALSDRVAKQRARLNPPPYSELSSEEPDASSQATTGARKLSIRKKKKRDGSTSSMTMYSGHSWTSTKGSADATLSGSRAEPSQLQPPTTRIRAIENVGGRVSAGGVESGSDGRNVETTLDGRVNQPSAV